MTERQSILIGACVVLTILALIIPSLFVRLILAGVVMTIAVVWFVALNRKTSDAQNPTLDQTTLT